MKAIRIHDVGGPEVLRYEDVPDPEPRLDQALIRVRACVLNHLDLWVRKGVSRTPLPHIPGSDVAGEVVQVGKYVSGCKPGQRVLLAPMSFCNRCQKCAAGLQNQCGEFSVLGHRVDGADCELIALPAVSVIPIPDTLDFDQAASIPLVFLTTWHMLVTRAGIRQGQTVLVLGANSGVGIAAVQIAKFFNARVLATAGNDTKMEKARALGADTVINHYQQTISEEVRKVTNKEGVNIVVEHVGAATWEESLKCLKPGGTLVPWGATYTRCGAQDAASRSHFAQNMPRLSRNRRGAAVFSRERHYIPPTGNTAAERALLGSFSHAWWHTQHFYGLGGSEWRDIH